jgi:cytochrome c5
VFRRFAPLIATAPLILAASYLVGCGHDVDPAAAGRGETAELLAEQQATGHGTVPAGRAVYDEFCASCHDTGVEDAPAIGNPADWEGRSGLWQAVLMEHAKAGYLEMPARGGEPALTDLDVSRAVEYMLLVTYPEKLPD